MIDVIVIRDPDASNDIVVFGDDEAVIVDIDLGRCDLSSPAEWDEWQATKREQHDELRWIDAQKLVRHVVAVTAENFGHPIPQWLL